MRPEFNLTRPHLRIRPGERIYRILTTPWIFGGKTTIIFRVISKVRRDGRIEVMHYSETQKGKFTEAAHAVFVEEKFPRFLRMVELALSQMFPGIQMVEERVTHLPMERLRMEFLFETPTVEPH